MTDKEVIARLKVSRRTLQEYRTERKIPYIVFGGKVLYRESDIEKCSRKTTARQSSENENGRCRSLPVSLFVRFNSEARPYTE